MKSALLIILSLPLLAFSQKVKVNEYDKYIKQRRVELEPLTIISSPTATVSLTFKSIGSTLCVLFSGFGWGTSTIDNRNEVIFLLSNDSTVAIQSSGLQTYRAGIPYNTYKHQYFITLPGLEQLSRYDVVGIRKYSFDDFEDVRIAKIQSAQIRKSSSLFIDELKKASVIQTYKEINLADVSKHMGDSVRVCSKVYSVQYIGAAASGKTLLNLGGNFPNQLLTAVIPEQYRKNFGDKLDITYKEKEACFSGRLEIYQKEPRMVIYKREQISVTTPIALEEVTNFIGDSVLLHGQVAAVNALANSQKGPMSLNMGTSQANQKLTVIIEDTVRKSFPKLPQNFFINKKIFVRGRIKVVNNKPQIIVSKMDQIGMLEEAVTLGSTGNYMSIAEATKKDTERKKAVEKGTKSSGGPKAWMTFINQRFQRQQGGKLEKAKQ